MKEESTFELLSSDKSAVCVCLVSHNGAALCSAQLWKPMKQCKRAVLDVWFPPTLYFLFAAEFTIVSTHFIERNVACFLHRVGVGIVQLFRSQSKKKTKIPAIQLVFLCLKTNLVDL